MSSVAALLRGAWAEVSGRAIFTAVVFLTAGVLALLVLSQICGLAAGAFTVCLALLAGAVTVELTEEDELAVNLNTQEQLLEYSQRATKRRAWFMRKLGWSKPEDEQQAEEDDEQQQESDVFEDEDDNRPVSMSELEMAARLHGRLEGLRQLEVELKRERDAAAAALEANSGADSAEALSEAMPAGTIPTSALCDEAAEAAQLLRLRPRRRGPAFDVEDSKLLGTSEPESRGEHAAAAEPPG
eukprot:TRINITY_DN15148_c0_g1_i1.p1 TRINITY_DN15148_c0_g1~~TRINITY_DN15148_c0_g1_i1.p1  ORF type:complete len:242 (+),score=69.73 TRINITY_DN15148_c0_g1_i1:81-806(+)